MAVVRARSSPPYALISTVIVAVAATVLAVLFYLNWNKAAQESADAVARLDKIASSSDRSTIVPNFQPGANEKASAMAVAQRQVNELKELISGDSKVSIESLKAEIGTNKPLLGTFKSLKTDRDAKAAALNALESQSKSLTKNVDARGKEVEDARAAAEGTVASLRDQISKLNAEIATANQGRDAAVQKAQDDIAKMTASQEELRRGLVLQIEQAKNELAKAEGQVAELKRKIGDSVKSADVNVSEPDGRVVRVNAAAGEVYISLTSKDNRVTPGLTFTAFDQRTGVRFGTDEAAMGNGSLEVIQVGETSTLCRITRVTKDRTIQAGDLIANIVYHNDKGRTFRFVVFGDFDLDGDGVATAAERDRLINMIRSWGGSVENSITPQTDYLVVGSKPSAPTMIEDAPGTATAPGSAVDQRMKQQDQYDTLVGDAKRLGIPVLNSNRFLSMIGYYNTTVIRY